MSGTRINYGLAASRVRTVRSATSYPAAERAVDFLAHWGFPVEHVWIVGSGLRAVVSERPSAGRAGVAGMGRGAALGLVWGLLFPVFFSGGLLGGLLFGLGVGVVFGGVLGAAARGRRVIAQTRAERYEIQVDDGFADEAERLLARMPLP
jgi:hypothetical protein